MEIGMSLLNGDNDDELFQPLKKRQRLESMVPAVQAKTASAAKALPLTASWLTGQLSEPRRGGQGCGRMVQWSRGRGCGGASRGNRGRGGSYGGCSGRCY